MDAMPMAPEEIRAIRDELGLSQAKLAPLIGYAEAQRVSELERGVFAPSGSVELLLRAYRDGLLAIDWLDREPAETIPDTLREMAAELNRIAGALGAAT